MSISVHDNKLISYTVNEDKKTILLETVYADQGSKEYTNIIFSNVLAYYFEDHSLQLGTIILDIEEATTDYILDKNWEKFEARKNWGWPGSWAKTREIAKAYFRDNAIKAYDIMPTCGLWLDSSQKYGNLFKEINRI